MIYSDEVCKNDSKVNVRVSACLIRADRQDILQQESNNLVT